EAPALEAEVQPAALVAPPTRPVPPVADGFPVVLGTLPAGHDVHVFFVVEVDDPVPAGVAAITTQATLTADEGLSLLSDDPDAGGATDPTLTPLDALLLLT